MQQEELAERRKGELRRGEALLIHSRPRGGKGRKRGEGSAVSKGRALNKPPTRPVGSDGRTRRRLAAKNL